MVNVGRRLLLLLMATLLVATMAVMTAGPASARDNNPQCKGRHLHGFNTKKQCKKFFKKQNRRDNDGRRFFGGRGGIIIIRDNDNDDHDNGIFDDHDGRRIFR